MYYIWDIQPYYVTVLVFIGLMALFKLAIMYLYISYLIQYQNADFQSHYLLEQKTEEKELELGFN